MLKCYFPYETIKTTKSHPVLVIANAEAGLTGKMYLVVSGGTSIYKNDKKRIINRFDLLCYKNKDWFKQWPSNSSEFGDTKFSFERKDILILPYTRDFFRVIPPSKSPKMGALDINNKNFKTIMTNLFKKAGVAKIIEERQREIVQK